MTSQREATFAKWRFYNHNKENNDITDNILITEYEKKFQAVKKHNFLLEYTYLELDIKFFSKSLK